MYEDKGFKAIAAILAAALVLFLLPALIYQPEGDGYLSSGSVSANGKATAEREIFVGGAVILEGFYTVKPSTTYGEFFTAVGLYANAHIFSYNDDTYINFNADSLIINFFDEGELMYAVNANTAEITELMSAGIPEYIALEIIAARVKAGGAFSEKYQLKDYIDAAHYEYIDYRIYCV